MVNVSNSVFFQTKRTHPIVKKKNCENEREIGFKYGSHRPGFGSFQCRVSNRNWILIEYQKLNSVFFPDRFTAVDKAFLARHNEYRAKHGSPPLQLRQDLIHLAQDWSNVSTHSIIWFSTTLYAQPLLYIWKQKLARRDELAHRPNNKFGECVSHAGSTDPITINAKVANDAVTAFYSEVYFYDFNNDSVATHFSQVVWKNTKYVGCGCATTRE